MTSERQPDHTEDQPSFGTALDGKAKILGHVRAPRVSSALERALDLLDKPEQSDPDDALVQALAVLRLGVTAQRRIVAGRMRAGGLEVDDRERRFVKAHVTVA